MSRLLFNSTHFRKGLSALLLLALGLSFPYAASAKNKKKETKTEDTTPVGPRKFPFDPTKLVWPAAPNVARVRWLDYFAGEKIDYSTTATTKPKASWMDRLAGGQSETEKASSKKLPFQLLGPFGMAVDSKGLLYVADQQVGAIFIFDPATHETQLIRNGFEAHFELLNCLAMDDDDRLFATDGRLHRVLIFSPKHEMQDQITEGLVDPVGIALDTTNRFLYVVDTQQDQVIVYDADTLKLLRRIGTGGKNHTLTSNGDFSTPQGVAVDSDGNVYVTDTLNNRVEIFDADGEFISEFGRHGDGPGYFSRPKGIAVDSDGHIWVADAMEDRLQVFNKEGQLMTYIGTGHGELPGQFDSLVGVAIDKQNHVYTSEQYPGRVQMFRYVTDSEAEAERARLDEEKKNARGSKKATAPAATDQPAQTPAPAQKNLDSPAQQGNTQPSDAVAK
jgi:sugar lactone lactonase YvrE